MRQRTPGRNGIRVEVVQEVTDRCGVGEALQVVTEAME
jgi:hypothetical protein